MALRFGLAAVVSLLVVSLFSVPHAVAGPQSWKMVETTCTSYNGGCTLEGDYYPDGACVSSNGGCPSGYATPSDPIALPVTIGLISGSGSFTMSGSYPSGELSETGDLAGYFGYVTLSPSDLANCFGFGCHGEIDLTSDSSGVFGDAYYGDYGTYINLEFDGSTFSGLWGSDGGLEGCGQFAQCVISGELVSTPEPSSLPLMLAGLGLIGGAMYFGRKKAATRV